MADKLSPEQRSRNMARIRGKNTAPEMTVRQLLHRLGYRYRLHVAGLPGRPDIVFPARRKVVFLHGCFWHRHLGCKYAYMPKSRVDFWRRKFDQNIARDERDLSALRAIGWEALVVWECEVRKVDTLRGRLVRFLETPNVFQRGDAEWRKKLSRT